MVRFYSGADGLKTGFTDAALYTMAVTAKRNNMRLIGIILGEKEGKVRNQEAMELLDYGFDNYKVDLLKSKNEVIDTINIEKGDKDKANVLLKDDLIILSKKSDKSINYDYQVDINYIKLPLNKGDIVGKIKLIDNSKVIEEKDLIIDDSINKISYLKYLFGKLKRIF